MITWPYVLRRGHSDDPAQGACAMDAINWLMHGRHGDQPPCVSPYLGTFTVVGNDGMPDDVRQRLLAYLPRLAGSRSAAHEAARLRILVLGAVRVFAPRALDAVGLTEPADRLRALPDDVSYAAAEAAAWAAAAAARAAAWAAADAAAARAAAAAARAAAAAARAAAEAALAAAALAAAAWDDYFAVLDAALRAGPEGEPWSADVIEAGTAAYRDAGGLVVETQR